MTTIAKTLIVKRLLILFLLGLSLHWALAGAWAQEAQPSSGASAASEEDSSTQATDAGAAEVQDEAAEADSSISSTAQEGDDQAANANPESEAPANAEETQTAVGETVAPRSATPTPPAGDGLSPLVIGVMLVALFVIPVLVGNWLANRVGLPDHGWKLSLIFVTIAAAIVIIGVAIPNNGFKFGPDLAGGITLIYELADYEAVADDVGEQAPGEEETGASRELVSRMTGALKQRVDPTGTREVTIRPYGSAIEIIIPRTGPEDLEVVKRDITSLGQLEFRITADPRWGERDRQIVELAQELPPDEKLVELNGEVVAEWVPYDTREFGEVDVPDTRVVKRMGDDQPEALVLRDHYNVTGEHLHKKGTKKGIDERGAPAVDFAFTAAGSKRFGRLTGENRPNPATGAQRFLGIILDKRLLSAPSIRERITDRGQISGGAMSEDEVDSIIRILEAGSLPAELNPDPISEEVISSTLGRETIQKGQVAIGVSLLAVLIFMLIYYRFAGIIACLALLANLLFVLSVMVLINAALTLPGLAGLVLTVGMSVDANVLIFERIREELSRGAALRMAIRNGFSRATTAIVDSNITTLITGIVLYVIGTDQIKGFAITLILGIVMSMYTAIFCARAIFDIAERRRWITTLKMSHPFGETNFDFLRQTAWAASLSLVLMAVGAVALWQRGTEILNIDFTGGTAVTMVFLDEHRTPFNEVRAVLEQTELAEKNLTVVERGGTLTRYTVTSTIDSVADVQEILREAFEGKLKTYDVQVTDVTADSSGGSLATLEVNSGPGYEEEPGVGHDPLMARLEAALASMDREGLEPTLDAPGFQPGSSAPHKKWTVHLGLDPDEARSMLEAVAADMSRQAMFPLSNKIGGSVAGNLQVQATWAVLISIIGVIGYLWLRFQKVTYGLAAVLAIVHDVLVTIGLIAISPYIVRSVPAVANALQIDSFQIGLTVVAALLTIMGYSLNDTIVIFDRIREVKGKSPQITAAMINSSMNQTLSRTILTSLTTLIVVVILYFFGGAGIHDFAFSLVVGVIAGTYSTMFIASPFLLAMSGTGRGTTTVKADTQAA